MRIVDQLKPEEAAVDKRPTTKTNRLFRWLFICIPMLLVGLYLVFFAADRYVSESKIFLTNVSPAEFGEAGIGNLLSRNSKSTEYLLYLKEYILSLDMLLKLDQDLDIRSGYSEPARDFWFRLPENATQEGFLDYYRSRVNVQVDNSASILTVTSEGFSPDLTLNLNQSILTESEEFINNLTQRVADELLSFAKNAAESSRTELKAARNALLELQNQYGILDPIAQADAANQVIAQLEAKNVELQAELRQVQSYLGKNTAQVEIIKSTINSIQEQISLERAKLAGSSGDEMNKILNQYLDAKARVDFSSDNYRLSLSALEGARAEAIRKLQSVMVIVQPKLPDEPSEPRKLNILGTLLLILVLLYGLIKLTWAVIEDHRDDM